MNLLLRNYLHYNLVEQADKLVLKTTFPEEASNNQFARYMLYLGRIKAIQLDYTSANRYLLQAIRKAPQTSKTVGFLQAVSILNIKEIIIIKLKTSYMNLFIDDNLIFND